MLLYIKAKISPMCGKENEISQSSKFAIWYRAQVYGLRQFHREIGVRILFIDVSRIVAEQSHVNFARRLIRHSSRKLQVPKIWYPYYNIASGQDISECLV